MIGAFLGGGGDAEEFLLSGVCPLPGLKIETRGTQILWLVESGGLRVDLARGVRGRARYSVADQWTLKISHL